MISVFDFNKLRGLLKDFYQLSRIRITVFDENRNELCSYPESIAEFCKIIRSCEAGRYACAQCDKAACERAGKERKTQIYRCHAGLTEAVTPLIVQDVLVGYLLFGHVYAYPDRESGWAEIQRCCKALPLDLEQLKAACLECPQVEPEYVRSATQILLAVASYLVMERMATLQTDQLAVRIDEYLSAHFTQRMRASDLCQQFQIGKTQLYKLSQQLYGCGISEHIRNLKIKMAKKLLEERPELSLAEIAVQCGYHDYNYFIHVFTQVTGTSPGAFRRWCTRPAGCGRPDPTPSKYHDSHFHL